MRIVDNQKNISLSKFKNQYPLLFNKVGNKTLGKLAASENVLIFPPSTRESEDLELSQKVVEVVNDSISIGNIIGTIGIDNEHLTIHSRFYNLYDNYFLYYMLEKVLHINLVNLQIGLSNHNQVFGFLVYIFPMYLENALRKGIYKEYRKLDYNDLNIRGQININNFIKYNVPVTNKISYSTRELTPDNSLVHLIRHTIEHIKTVTEVGSKIITQNKNIERHVKEIINNTPNYKRRDRTKIIRENTQKRVVHPYFTEYRELQKICLMILENKKHGIDFSNSKIHGVLFDVSWLWEEYIASFTDDLFVHSQNRAGIGREYLFEKTRGPIFPDFVGKDILDDFIADTKYKRSNGIKSEDYHQMLSYMYRFERKKGVFIHPRNNSNTEEQDLRLLLMSGFGMKSIKREPETIVFKTGFVVPENKNYSYCDYKKKMIESEHKLIEDLISNVETNRVG